MDLELEVRMRGADQTLRALKTLEPTVARKIERQVTDIGRTLAATVQASLSSSPPVSGWVATSGARGTRGGSGWPAWSVPKVTSRRAKMSVRITMAGDPIATMAEIIGRRTSIETVAGARLVLYMNNRLGPPVQAGKKSGRYMRKAIRDEYPHVWEQLRQACADATDEVNRRMP